MTDVQTYEPPGFTTPNTLIVKGLRRGTMLQLDGARCVANIASELMPDDLATLTAKGNAFVEDVVALGPVATAAQYALERRTIYERHMEQLALARERGDERNISILLAQSYELAGLAQSADAAAKRAETAPSEAIPASGARQATLRW